MNDIDISTNAIELKKIEIEQGKLDIEREKLTIEKQKAMWSAVSVAIPILVVAATVSLGIWSQYQRSRDDFELKAVEILLSAQTPNGSKNKAKALSAFFPTKLPSNFADRFDPSQFDSKTIDTTPTQKEIVQLMASKPEYAMNIFAIWKAMFPDDQWLAQFEQNLLSNHQLQLTPKSQRN